MTVTMLVDFKYTGQISRVCVSVLRVVVELHEYDAV